MVKPIFEIKSILLYVFKSNAINNQFDQTYFMFELMGETTNGGGGCS